MQLKHGRDVIHARVGVTRLGVMWTLHRSAKLSLQFFTRVFSFNRALYIKENDKRVITSTAS